MSAAVRGALVVGKGGGRLTSGGKVYHAQKAIMKPNQEKKKTRP